MSSAWNFPCYNPCDWYNLDNPSDRNRHGLIWEIGPGAFRNPTSSQPFSTSITCLFSFYFRLGGWSAYTSGDGHCTGLSIGQQGGTQAALSMYVGYPPDDMKMRVKFWNGAYVYELELGDENNIDWMQPGKMYQVGISADENGISYCVNGNPAPKTLVTTNNPGPLNLNAGNERIWVHNYSANWNQDDAILVSSGYSSLVHGASCWSTQKLDFSDSVVRDRIWDVNGDFKPCGGDGSYWFGDVYGDNPPEFYFLDGSPRVDNGAYNVAQAQIWETNRGGGASSVTVPGGLKKQYESSDIGDWQYLDTAAAEASGDAWVDGDEIMMYSGTRFIYMSDLAVSGYSGLIHKYPFGRGHGTLSAVSLKGSEGADTDPNTWTNYTNNSVGTQGVDYELDTDGGVSRLRDLSDAGGVVMDGTYAITSADVEGFRIIDLATCVTLSGANNQEIQQHLRIYKDASNYWVCKTSNFSNLWQIVPDAGLTSSGVSTLTPARMYMYIKEDFAALWFDDNPARSTGSTTNTRVEAGSGVPMSESRCYSTSAGTTLEMKMGTDVFGSMTTS